jgi:hypothetical protein
MLLFSDLSRKNKEMLQRIQTMAMVAALMVSASTFAQDSIHPYLDSKFRLSVGGFYPTQSVTLSVEGPNPLFDGDFDLEGSVGLRDREGLWIGEFGWQFGEKWAINAQYFQTSRNRQFVLQKQIEWKDIVYDVGADIAAGTDASITRLFFSRKMLKYGRHDLQLGAGIHWLTVGAFIEGNATLDDQTVEFRASAVSAEAPLPNLGAWYRYAPSDRWMFSLRADWFSASFGDISGRLINLFAGVNYRVYKNFGVGVNYQRFSLDGRVKESDWRGDLEVIYSGPQFVVGGTW